LGTFTHNNFPIQSGGGIESVDLKMKVDLTASGTAVTLNKTFTFEHWETPNQANPCADGGANGVGVNYNGCADRVLLPTGASSENFFVPGEGTYTVTLIGFGSTPQSATPEFWTKEKKANVAYVWAKFEFVPDDQQTGIPEPSTYMLMGAGLLGLGWLNRRKNKA
jgi:hypothetical protein